MNLTPWGQRKPREIELFPDRPPATFGEWLPRGIRAARLTVHDLAQEIGVPAELVCDWMADKGLPTPRDMPRLAAVLGADPAYLFNLAGWQPLLFDEADLQVEGDGSDM